VVYTPKRRTILLKAVLGYAIMLLLVVDPKHHFFVSTYEQLITFSSVATIYL
jgi:hypothetical protein